MQKNIKKMLSMILTLAMVLTLLVPQTEVFAKAKVKNLTISDKKITLVVGKKASLSIKAKIKGKKKAKAIKANKVKWTSSDKKVATVNKKGKITAKKKGTATITAKYSGKTAKCKVTVLAKGDKDDGDGGDGGNGGGGQDNQNEEVTIYMTPEDGVIRSEGTTVTLKAVPRKSGSGVPAYQWYKDGAAISNGTQNTYYAASAGKYSVEVKYSDLTLKSGTVTVTSTVTGPTSNVVKWTVESEPFEGKYPYKDEETGKTYIYPILLKREYVSFNPWPTTVGQVEYVIKNCKDPFVIGALYVVALDNYKYTKLTDNNCGKLCFSMLDTLALGAGALTETNPGTPQYCLTNVEKGNINSGAYNSKAYKKDGVTLSSHIVRDFAPRTFLKGATPENGYAPNGNIADINDKTKWKIKVDQYVYCFDQVAGNSADADPVVASEAKTIVVKVVNDKGEETGETETIENFRMPALHKEPTAITVCPTTFKYTTEDGVEFQSKEHNSGIRIGLQYSSKKNVWIPCDNVSINKAVHGTFITPVKKYLSSNLFSTSHYAAPVDANDDL